MRTRTCLTLKDETLSQLRAMSEKTDVPQSRIVERALKLYFELKDGQND